MRLFLKLKLERFTELDYNDYLEYIKSIRMSVVWPQGKRAKSNKKT